MPTFGDLSQYKQKSNTYTVPSYVAQQKYSLTDLRKDEEFNKITERFLTSLGKIDKAKDIKHSALKFNPRNLLLNQYKLDFNNEKKTLSFNFKNKNLSFGFKLFYLVSSAPALYNINIKKCLHFFLFDSF